MTVPNHDVEQQVVDLVRALPRERAIAVLEFAAFLFAREESSAPHPQPLPAQEEPSSFLLSVAALGRSGEGDIAERDEEILAAEVDPIRGWGSEKDERPA